MRRTSKVFAGLVLASVLALSAPVQAQFSGQVQQLWDAIRTGALKFNNLAVIASGYLTFGATVGTNGYGIRDSAGTIQYKNSGGAWVSLPSGGSAPATSKYLLQVADASLPNAQAMGALASGFVLNTTATGVQSVWTGSGCNNSFISNIAANGTLTCNSQPGTAGLADWGASGFAWRNIYFSGASGTPGTNDFEITGTSTGGHRVITFPDASISVARTDAAQSFSGIQTFSTSVATPLLTQVSGTVTASTPLQTQTQTWNNGAVTFIGNSWVFSQTAYAAASRYFQILGGAAGTATEFAVGSDGNVIIGATLAVGGTPATDGVIRIPNGGAIRARNATNAADLTLMYLSGSNKIRIDNDSTGVQIGGQVTLETIGAFVAGDKYLVADASGNIHKSATGPASSPEAHVLTEDEYADFLAMRQVWLKSGVQ